MPPTSGATFADILEMSGEDVMDGDNIKGRWGEGTEGVRMVGGGFIKFCEQDGPRRTPEVSRGYLACYPKEI